MIAWLRRHADPDECLVIIIAIGCVWAGWATWHDILGKPRDAPHLRIPGTWRSFIWWGCALVGLVALRFPRGCWARRWAHSFLGIGFMISFRLGSYLASWVCSWDWVDALIPDETIKGDPLAWGSMWLYYIGEVAVLCLMLAPWSWDYLNAAHGRRGRLQRKERP